MWFMRFSRANCKNCYACARACPVQAIKVKDDKAEVIKDRCIVCGNCFKVCPQSAKIIKSDVDTVKSYINSNYKVIASIAPSFAAIFGKHSNKIKTALEKLGFDYIEETVTVVNNIEEKYSEYANKNDKLSYITSFCPSITQLIQKHYPELIPNLIPIASPAVYHARILKNRFGKDVKIVFIGPCLAKKIEGDEEEAIDSVLTFVELLEWIKLEGIDISTLEECEFDFVNMQKRLFPIVGEPTKAIEEKNPEKTVIQIEGQKDSMKILKDIKKGKFENTLFELSYCRHSCLGGSGMPNDGVNCYERRIRIKQHAKCLNIKDNRDKFEKYDYENKYKLAYIPLDKRYVSLKKELKTPTDQELRDILKSMGKYIKKDELNCGSCGYPTCREKAIAVYNNIAEIEMCLPYMRDKAETLTNIIFDATPNLITIVDKNLDIIKMNRSSEQFFNTNVQRGKGLPVLMYLDEEKFIQVRDSKKNIIREKVIIQENNKTLIQSILWIEHNKVMLWIADDISKNEELEKKLKEKKIEAVDMAQRVIDKQMIVAQEIASLLGETTAETKVTLTKLKKLINEEVR